MPKRDDIKTILLIGSGPIIIGQACEFDYSGAQACKALREEGYRVVLVNSNPATIMTDPQLSDKTYIEPLTPTFLTQIIEKEKPDALLPTLGGQTGLNLAMRLSQKGILKKHHVEMLGATEAVINKAEDRQLFKKAMQNIGLESAKSGIAYTLKEAHQVAEQLGYPCVVRPAFTLGGTGGGIAYNIDELEQIVAAGLRDSLISEVLIEESLLGWKEFELEVMRDRNDNVMVVCSIENLDPMGVHTGDSITVAPIQTLTDREYQNMRNAAIAIMREIGVETGGSNVQFAINPTDGRMLVIEMNPRVSRSSALASKATGFPIAKFAAKLAVGYTLDELKNDITQKTPACFEPTLDYCVVKIPRFNFEKFKPSPEILGTAMKSVGETMSIGRTFKEALQKGLRSLEIKRAGLGFDGKDLHRVSEEILIQKLTQPNPSRLFYVQHALNHGYSIEQLYNYTQIDPWFLVQIQQITQFKDTIQLNKDSIIAAKRLGFSDLQLAQIIYKNTDETTIRQFRKKHHILPTYKLVDTCAAEFEAYTPYYYSTYETENESHPTDTPKIMILGGGPNRIGQGIEFDYCCVHASMAARDMGVQSIMVNSNPETVSTDFDISDKLYFEPLTFEDVLNIYELENPLGIIVQFGGQTPLNLSTKLEAAGVKILGTNSESIDRAEDRKRFQELIQKLNLTQPNNGTATTFDEAVHIAEHIGYPILVRPSYVLGGAAMEVVYDHDELNYYISLAKDISPEHPILLDQYLENAIEVDVDALSDGKDVIVAGIMEHIEQAGIHSGDSACSLPPNTLSPTVINEIKSSTAKLAIELHIMGLLNIQFAVQNNQVYILEVNPRASRSVPFVSKATGIAWAKMATKIMLGKSIKSLKLSETNPTYTSIKESVFPFKKFPGVDVQLGPEMKSTGEVMGIDPLFEIAFLKALLAAGHTIPQSGAVFISVKDADKNKQLVTLASDFIALGFTLFSTIGTAKYLSQHNIDCQPAKKVLEGRPNITDFIKNGDIQLIINTPSGKNPRKDEIQIRLTALDQKVACITTLPYAQATIKAIQALKNKSSNVSPLQAYYQI